MNEINLFNASLGFNGFERASALMPLMLYNDFFKIILRKHE